MKALADYVMANGLKLGIYSTPWSQDLRKIRRQLTATKSRTLKLTLNGASTI